jgi:YegS/Rv2252/BmrU family lipid kinase
VRTEKPWHAAELAERAVADGFDVVVAVGGDGTANEVLNGLMQAKQAGEESAAMGVLSVGRGNDFAFGVGVPRDLAAACRVLAQDQRRWVDVGRVVGGDYPQGRYFGNGIGVGFDTVVGLVAQKMKWLRGFFGYFVATLKTVFLYFRAPTVQISLDEETTTQAALMVAIMNGRRVGGGFMMAPQAQLDDGLLDFCIADEVSRARIFGLIPHFIKGTQATQPEIRTGRARRVVVTAIEGVLPGHADGEVLCTEGRQLTIELLPRQIEVLYQAPETEQ